MTLLLFVGVPVLVAGGAASWRAYLAGYDRGAIAIVDELLDAGVTITAEQLDAARARL